MPVKGRKPKANPRHRNAPVHEWVEVLDVPFEGAPKLPTRRIGGKSWPKRTRDWWRAVSTMPHCATWAESDWSFAIDTALLAAEYHDGHTAAAPELRQREKILGTTLDARRDLRIRYLRPEPATEGDDGGGWIITSSNTGPSVPPLARMEDYRQLYGEEG